MLLNNPPGGKNRISKNVAYLLHARVALYEATWEKYHRGTAFVPGGSGWPGKDAQGYDADVEINYFLDEAIAASKFVADQMVGSNFFLTRNPKRITCSACLIICIIIFSKKINAILIIYSNKLIVIYGISC